MGKGRPVKIVEDAQAKLVKLVLERPAMSTGELCEAFFRESGIKAHGQTVLKSLKEAGIERISSREVVKVEVATGEEKRYGDTERHRKGFPERAC